MNALAHFALITLLEVVEGLAGITLFAFVIGVLYCSMHIIGKRNAEKRALARERRTNRIIEDLRAKERRSKEIRVLGSARRGPERVVGPESRERLPFQGRTR